MYVQLFNVHVRWLYSFIGFSAKCWAMERILLRLLWLLEQLWWWRLYKKWFASIERVISLWAFCSQLFYIDNYSLFLLCYFCLVECFNWIWTEMLEIKFWHIQSSYLEIFYSTVPTFNFSPFDILCFIISIWAFQFLIPPSWNFHRSLFAKRINFYNL